MTTCSWTAGSTLPSLLWNNARTRGRSVAIREKHLGIWQETTWSDYLAHVRRFALGLIAMGLKKGDPVAIQAENCQEWLFSDLAVQCAGGIVATVYSTSSADEVLHILGNSGARMVVVGDQEHLDKVMEVRQRGTQVERIIIIDPKGCREHLGEFVARYKYVESLGAELDASDPNRFESLVFSVRPDDVYDIMYTSGTSGLPKGAMCLQWGAVEGARGMLEALSIGPDDSWLSYLPLSHAFERIASITMHLLSGCTISFADTIDTVQADLFEIQPTIFGAVPRIIEKMKTSIDIRIGNSTPVKRAIYKFALAAGLRRVAYQRINLDTFRKVPPERIVTYSDVRPVSAKWRLIDRVIYLIAYVVVLRQLRKNIGLLGARCVLCGAAPMSKGLFEYFIALGVPIINGFGMTELHNIPCLSLPFNYVQRTVGHVLPGWEIKNNDDGEFLVKGPLGFVGYKGQEAEVARAKDSEGWLHTGDLADIFDNGYASIIGRKKDVMITSGGKNISPEFIENKLKASRFISEGIVIGDGRRYIVALIELDPDAVGDYLQQAGIAYTTLRHMATHSEVIKLIQREIDTVNSTLGRVETVKKFAIIPRDLSHDDGEMTPTRKVKRSQIEKIFGDLIDEMYK
jgi:long-chain acyl-CoA synthetase